MPLVFEQTKDRNDRPAWRVYRDAVFLGRVAHLDGHLDEYGFIAHDLALFTASELRELAEFMAATVTVTLIGRFDKTRYRVTLPAEYTTRDWAVHRPYVYTRPDGTHALGSSTWRVTCRHSGLLAWEGKSLTRAKRHARALQKATDTHGHIPEDGKPTPATLHAHAAAIGLTRQEARDA